MLSNDPTSVLALLPVPFALQVWNTGACALAAWTATACLLSFINSVVWAGNVMDTVPVWCDICTLQCFCSVQASVSPPPVSASPIDSGRSPQRVMSQKPVAKCVAILLIHPSNSQRLQTLLTIAIDLTLSAGIPLLVMLLRQSASLTLSQQLTYSPPVLTLRLSYVHRLEFDHALAKLGTLRTGLCLRLVLLALVALTVSVVSSSLNIAALARSGPLIPWSEARRMWVPGSDSAPSPSFTQTANSSASELASVPPWRSSVSPEWDPAFPSPDVSAVSSSTSSSSSSTSSSSTSSSSTSSSSPYTSTTVTSTSTTPDVALVAYSTWHAAPLPAAAVEAARWAPVICALAFFVLFGLAGEASYHARVAHVFRKRGPVSGFKLPHPKWEIATPSKWEKAWADNNHGTAAKTTYLGSLKTPAFSNIDVKANEKGVSADKGATAVSSIPFYVAQVGQDASDDPFASTRKDPFAPADLSASRSRSLELCRTRSMYSEGRSMYGEGLSRASSASSVYTARTSPGRRSTAESVPALPVNVIPPSPEAPQRQQSLTSKTSTTNKSLPEVPCDTDSERSPRLPSRSLMGGPSEETLPRFHLHPTQGLLPTGQHSTLAVDRPRTPSARHAPQDSVTSLTSCDSLATSLGSSRDVIYISDAYATDPTHAYHANHGYWARASADSGYAHASSGHGAGFGHSQHTYYTTPLGAQPSPPPFSNLIPAPAAPEASAEVGRAAARGH
ncbi:hypothetical protein FB107DRAFT_263871, partial [Schizophyllum commune]